MKLTRIACLLLLVARPLAASGETVNYCNDAEVQQDWSKLMAKYRHIPEWQDIDRYRTTLCNEVNSGEISVEAAIELFENARTQKIEELRERIKRQMPTEQDRASRSQIG